MFSLRGTCHNGQRDYAECSMIVDPEKRGKGMGKVLAHHGYEYAFTCLGISVIYGEIRPENVASIKISEEIGAIFQGMREGLRTYLLTREGMRGFVSEAKMNFSLTRERAPF